MPTSPSKLCIRYRKDSSNTPHFTKEMKQGDVVLSLHELYDDACRDRDEAKRQLRKLKRSLSWRVTGPLRHVAKVLHTSGRWLRKAAKKVSVSRPMVAPPPLRHMSDGAFLAYIAQQQAQNRPVFVQLTPMAWDVPLFQRPQHMSTAMSANGAVAIFASSEVREQVSDVRELNPETWLITNRALLLQLSGCIFSIYSTDFHTKINYISKIRRDNIVLYEYIDHINEEIFGHENISTLQRVKEFAFSGGVDLIVASAKSLYDEAAMIAGGKRTLLVPNGVDYSHFAATQRQGKPCAKQMEAFKKHYPHIVGYFGALAPWLWYDVINELTKLRPDLGFVFIGPGYFTGKHRIISRKNVLLTGPVAYSELPNYASAFDVSIIPFKPGEIAQTTSPLKLFEYFALEKPVVVSSTMVECIQFPEVASANNADEFSEAIDQCLSLCDTAEFRERLRLLALENTWSQRAANILIATSSWLQEYRDG